MFGHDSPAIDPDRSTSSAALQPFTFPRQRQMLIERGAMPPAAKSGRRPCLGGFYELDWMRPGSTMA